MFSSIPFFKKIIQGTAELQTLLVKCVVSEIFLMFLFIWAQLDQNQLVNQS